MDRDDFPMYRLWLAMIRPIEAIFHQGACSATTEWDGKYMMLNNFL